jgi:hypothetical protein
MVGLLMVAPVAMARYTTPPTGSRLRPLPGSPVVKKTAREVIEFEGQNHSPKVEVKWKYSVEAMTRSGHALGGNVLTQFLYGGAVVGKEAPAYHKLRHGKLADKVPFPSQSAGIRLTVQVVVTTRYGSVKLNWPVKPVSK